MGQDVSIVLPLDMRKLIFLTMDPLSRTMMAWTCRPYHLMYRAWTQKGERPLHVLYHMGRFGTVGQLQWAYNLGYHCDCSVESLIRGNPRASFLRLMLPREARDSKRHDTTCVCHKIAEGLVHNRTECLDMIQWMRSRDLPTTDLVQSAVISACSMGDEDFLSRIVQSERGSERLGPRASSVSPLSVGLDFAKQCVSAALTNKHWDFPYVLLRTIFCDVIRLRLIWFAPEDLAQMPESFLRSLINHMAPFYLVPGERCIYDEVMLWAVAGSGGHVWLLDLLESNAHLTSEPKIIERRHNLSMGALSSGHVALVERILGPPYNYPLALYQEDDFESLWDSISSGSVPMFELFWARYVAEYDEPTMRNSLALHIYLAIEHPATFHRVWPLVQHDPMWDQVPIFDDVKDIVKGALVRAARRGNVSIFKTLCQQWPEILTQYNQKIFTEAYWSGNIPILAYMRETLGHAFFEPGQNVRILITPGYRMNLETMEWLYTHHPGLIPTQGFYDQFGLDGVKWLATRGLLKDRIGCIVQEAANRGDSHTIRWLVSSGQFVWDSGYLTRAHSTLVTRTLKNSMGCPSLPFEVGPHLRLDRWDALYRLTSISMPPLDSKGEGGGKKRSSDSDEEDSYEEEKKIEARNLRLQHRRRTERK
jgi:hypothetical protein